MTTPIPAAQLVTAPHTASVARRLLRIVLAIAVLALGALTIVFESTFRVTESRILAAVVERVFSGHAVASWSAGQPAVAYQLGESWFAVRITVQCSIALYLGPVAVLAGLLVLSRRVRIGRVLVAGTTGIVALVVLNQVRLVLIAFAYGTGGMDAFNWVHGPVGTALMLIGIAGTLVLFFVLCLTR